MVCGRCRILGCEMPKSRTQNPEFPDAEGLKSATQNPKSGVGEVLKSVTQNPKFVPWSKSTIGDPKTLNFLAKIGDPKR